MSQSTLSLWRQRCTALSSLKRPKPSTSGERGSVLNLYSVTKVPDMPAPKRPKSLFSPRQRRATSKPEVLSLPRFSFLTVMTSTKPSEKRFTMAGLL